MQTAKKMCLVALLCFSSVNAVSAVMVRDYSFPDLVADAELVVLGGIVLEDGQPVLVVDQFIKGTGNATIRVGSRGIGDIPQAKLHEEDRVLLFLNPPDVTGTAFLVGYSDQGKWPQSHRTDTYGRADVPALARLVTVVERVLTQKGFEEQARGIVAMMRSDDELAQLAGLDIALSQALARSLPQSQRRSGMQSLAAFALPLLRSANRDVRGTAIRLITSAPNAVAASALTPLIADPDPWCRRQVRASLARLLMDCKITDPKIRQWIKGPVSPEGGSGPEDSDAGEMKALFEAAWEDKREQTLTREVPRLKAGLASASAIERESSALYLKYLGISE